MAEPEAVVGGDSSCCTRRPFQYDVFISFRGFDTREGFTLHLYQMLKTHQIVTFFDSEALEKGEQIKELFQYISNSQIYVVVMSPNYANSRWCLSELVRIVKSRRRYVPVFYKVDPSDVKHQTGMFGEEFRKMMKINSVDVEEMGLEWRDALIEVGNASGYVVTTNGDDWEEKRIIELIVNDVLKKVRRSINIAENPIGVQTHVDRVLRQLEDSSSVVVIQGIGGVGKTTIAKAIYNAKLPDTSFYSIAVLLNVREVTKTEGVVALQKQLITKVLKIEEPNIYNVDEGKTEIQKRLQNKVLFLIIDDVDNCIQLESLVGSMEWFREGSKLVITTRDGSVSKKHFGDDHCSIYQLAFLELDQSMELFCLHAFKINQPPKEFIELSEGFVEASGGLPLALTIYGSHLCIHRDASYWKSYLEKIKAIPESDIESRLRTSYDSLEKIEQQVFLDIACLFIGKDTENPIYMWEAAGYYPKISVDVLIAKSLIDIDENNTFRMHDLIRDMGRRVVESDPIEGIRIAATAGKVNEIVNAKGNENVEAIYGSGQIINSYGVPVDEEEASNLSSLRLKEMPKLRLLKLDCCVLNIKELEIPPNLTWLELLGFCSRSEREPIEIVNLCKSTSIAPQKNQILSNLVILYIQGYFKLVHTIDFRRCPNVKKLGICDVAEDFELDSSVGCLQSLVHLQISNYHGTALPDEVCSLTSLQSLILETPSELRSLPSQLGNLKSLEMLYIGFSPFIEELPESITCLTSLRSLKCPNCEKLKKIPSLQTLTALKSLNMYGSDLESISHPLPSSLEDVDLSNIKRLKEFPHDLQRLTSLKSLLLSDSLLESVSPLPSSIEILNLCNTRRLEKLPDLMSLTALKSLRLYESAVESIPSLPSSLEYLEINGTKRLKKLPDNLVKLTALKKLYAGGSALESISSLPSSLEDLELESTEKLKELPDMHTLTSLRTLSLCGSGLAYIPRLPSSLVCLGLRETRIKEFPDFFTCLTNLQFLNISGVAEFEELPDTLQQLQTLVKDLNLYWTRINPQGDLEEEEDEKEDDDDEEEEDEKEEDDDEEEEEATEILDTETTLVKKLEVARESLAYWKEKKREAEEKCVEWEAEVQHCEQLLAVKANT